MTDIHASPRTVPIPRVPEVAAELQRLIDTRARQASAYGPAFTTLWDAGAANLIGGKLVRPRLLLAAFDALADESPTDAAERDAAVRIAAAVEVLHYSFLLHDDVLDGDLLRRGRPNLIGAILNSRASEQAPTTQKDLHWARSNGILLGDLLLSMAHQTFAREPLPEDQRVRLLDLLDHAVTESVVGELLDIGLADGALPAELTTVLEMTRLKTAAYTFELPLRAAAILAGARGRVETAVGDLGRHLGVAFQLQDDLLSMFGNPAEHGKDAYSDLREGKETATIAYARLTGAWPRIAPLFGTGQRLSDADGVLVRELLRECGAEQFTHSLIDDQLRACFELLSSADARIPASLTPIIDDLVDALEERTS